MPEPSADRPAASPSNNLRGIAMVLVATAMFGAMSGGVRHVSTDMHPFEIAFFRNFFGFLSLMPFLMRYGLEPLKTRRYGFLALRGILNATSMTLFFVALTLVPIAKVSALAATTPLFATLLAILLLGERMGLRRWIGLLVGFGGAIVILRPGYGEINIGIVYSLVSATIWACAIIVIKSLARTEPSLTITLYGVLFLMPFTLVPALFVWQWPTWVQLGWLAALGSVGTMGHLAFAQAMRYADASLVVPFDFTKLLWAALIGFVFFAEVPSIWTWIGGTAIFASATYIAYRERQADLAEAQAETRAETKTGK